MKLWQKNGVLLIIVIALVVIPLLMIRDAEFAGSDGEAESVIQEIDGDYTPWIEPLFEPASGEIESMLFALQAAIGAGIIGFCFGRLSARKKSSEPK